MPDHSLHAAAVSSEIDRLTDLLGRTQRAETEISRLARTSAVAKSAYSATERHRLEGKAEGMRLAIAYIGETLRDAEAAVAHREVAHA